MGMWVHGAAGAARRLARRPLWAVLVVAILAVGIGATTAVFSVVEGVALRGLPYDDPTALVRIGGTRLGRPGLGALSGPDFRMLESRVTRLSDVAASTPSPIAVGTEGGPADQLRGGYVSGAFFLMLGRDAVLGRVLRPEDDRPGAAPVAVLSHAVWQGRFGGGDVLGRTLELDGQPVTVVGVMGPDFHPPEGAHLGGTLLWLPLSAGPLPLGEAGLSFLDVLGRMAPGATAEQVAAELETLGQAIRGAGGRGERHVSGFAMASLTKETVGDARSTLGFLLGAAALLLVIACANVVNLMLVRSGDRASELAVRVSLGAGRARILGEALFEGVLLSAAAGTLGIVLAHLGVGALTRAAPVDLPRLQEVTVDGPILGFAVGLSAVVGILVGLAPAVRVLRRDALDGMLRTLRGEHGSRRAGRVRDGLVVAQAALGLVLLVGAGLLINSLVRLHRVDPGLRADGLHVLSVTTGDPDVAGPGADPTEQTAMLEAVAAVPGVREVSLTSGAPFVGGGWSVYVQPEGSDIPDEELWATRIGLHQVSANHMSNMGIRILSGREIVASDLRGGDPVVLISKRLADTYWGGRDPVGSRLVVGGDGTFALRTIVGVVEAPRYGGPASADEQHLYLPYTDFPPAHFDLALRTDALDPALVDALRRAVYGVDPGASIQGLVSMKEARGRYFVEPSFYTWLLTGYGAVALLLAAVGLYGTLAFAIGRQRRALGIRMALGADGRRLVREVVRRGVVMTAMGVAMGLAVAVSAAGALDGLIFGITPTDPLTYVVAAAALLATGLVASWLPARDAGRTEPVESLRTD